MDLESIESFSEVRPRVYRAAMKLQALQRLCHMNVVLVQHVTAALRSVGRVQRDIMMSREEVRRALTRMFNSVSEELQGHVTAVAPEETCSLMFRLFDPSQSGGVSARSLQTALIALSSDNLLLKYRGLLQISMSPSGSISRPGLRCLLQDLSQVPAAVREEVVFGDVDAAVQSCFNRLLTPTVSEHHVLSWLQSEPRLLLWLPTLYRLTTSQRVTHHVRCHTCKTRPFTGLRYRCLKCVNVHVCQNCFLTDRQTGKHKTHHPVLEFCTQPTWRESLTSLVHSARHTLLPQRYTQIEVNKRVLMWAEPGETEDRAPPPSDASTPLADSAHSCSSDRHVSHDASEPPPPIHCSSSCKSLQTDEDVPSQQVVVLLADVRNLQRDRWLLEQELQALRLTVQSEQGVLEDRCSEMEVTMETLRQHNARLQEMLAQAMSKMEAQQHASNTPHDTENTENTDNIENTENTETGNTTPSSDASTNTEEEEGDEEEEDECNQEEIYTPPLTIQQGPPPSYDGSCEEEEEFAANVSPHHRIRQQHGPEEAGLREHTCQSDEEGDERDDGMCSPEKVLQDTVEGLKAAMEIHRRINTGERTRAGLLQAAEEVGDSMFHLVDAVRTN